MNEDQIVKNDRPYILINEKTGESTIVYPSLEAKQIAEARQRDEAAARALGDHTPVEQILATMSDQYAIFVQCAAIVDAVARQQGVNCHCHGDHIPNCPVAEAIALVKRMSSM